MSEISSWEKDLTNLCEEAFKFPKNGSDEEQSYEEKFEDQRRNVPKAHTLRNKINRLSKKGIKALTAGDLEEVKRCYNFALEKMAELSMLDLPEDSWWDFTGDGGKEFMEFVFTTIFYPIIIDGGQMPKRLPDAYEHYVRPQTYLASIPEAISELGKLVNRFLLSVGAKELDRRIAVRQRFTKVAEIFHDILEDKFAHFPPGIMNNERARNFRSTFRGQLQKTVDIIDQHAIALNLIYDQLACRRA